MRVVAIVIDSGGVGALADADAYGDAPGADTIGNVARRLGSLALPNLQRLGLGSLTQIPGVAPVANPEAQRRPPARTQPRKTYDHGALGDDGRGYPGALSDLPGGLSAGGHRAIHADNRQAAARKRAGLRNRDHRAARRRAYGERAPILYTSADSVFQIAAHEEIVPLHVLLEWSARAREMLRPPANVNRVIARPFLGDRGLFGGKRPNRLDYAFQPPPNLLEDELRAGDIEVHAEERFRTSTADAPIATSARAAGNREAMEKTFELLEQVDHGFDLHESQ